MSKESFFTIIGCITLAVALWNVGIPFIGWMIDFIEDLKRDKYYRDLHAGWDEEVTLDDPEYCLVDLEYAEVGTIHPEIADVHFKSSDTRIVKYEDIEWFLENLPQRTNGCLMSVVVYNEKKTAIMTAGMDWVKYDEDCSIITGIGSLMPLGVKQHPKL